MKKLRSIQIVNGSVMSWYARIRPSMRVVEPQALVEDVQRDQERDERREPEAQEQEGELLLQRET